ncbi:MAG: cysteine dioxygenase family protein [Planctomycetota bacterium]
MPSSIAGIIEICQRQGIRSAREASQTLRKSQVTADDLLPWAKFDHPAQDGYGRQAIAIGEDFELMVMTWLPGDFSAIHDHGHTQWGAVMYFGAAEHAIFRLDGDILRTTERSIMAPLQVNEVDHDLIHQMGNPNVAPFLSLHLYGCNRPIDEVTGDARLFDLSEKRIQYTNGGVFYCLPESAITKRGDVICGDQETTMEHHQQMLDRIERILRCPSTGNQRNAESIKRLADKLKIEMRQLQQVSHILA